MNGEHRQASLEQAVHRQGCPDPVDTDSLKWEVIRSMDNYYIMYRERGLLGQPGDESFILDMKNYKRAFLKECVWETHP